MRIRTGWTVLGAACALAAVFPLSASPLKDLQQEAPGMRVYSQNGEISRLYGVPMSTGGDVYQSAKNFLDHHADVLGVGADDLVLRPASLDLDVQPVMIDLKTGDYKFVAMYYQQMYRGLPVFGGEVTLLFGNQPGFPLVEVISNLKNVGNFDVPTNGVRAPNAVGQNDLMTADLDQMQKVIFINPNEGEGDVPTLAYTYVVQIGDPGADIGVDVFGNQRDGTYDVRRVFVDAKTGELLHSESLIRAIDVEGNVSGWATPGLLPDRSDNPPTVLPLPDAYVQILGGNRATTDVNGDFIISNSGSDPVTVRSDMHGPALSGGVNDQAGGELLIDLDVTPPGPANFEHNPTPNEFDTAEVNAMIHASIIHSFLASINPAFPGLGRSFLANVNIASTCNAYYDGASINFYRAGGGCVNTAYTTVIYHEYGHKIVDDGSSNPSGDYHEGMADCVAMVLTDDAVVGRGFSGPGSMVRTGDNDTQYPCNGEVHFCGQVISGAVWHTREELFITEPDDYLDIIRNLTISSVLLHSGGINPGVTIDFLTLDDDDNDITNGTPHYDEINTGFSRHNLPAPPIQFLDFDYPKGKPDAISPDGGTSMRVVVSGNVSDPEPDTGVLHFNDGSGWVEQPMTYLGNNEYDAVFPAVDCPAVVSFYVSAETTGGRDVTDPADAPDTSYSAFGANEVVEVFADDFQTNKGWTVENIDLTDGDWQRAVPSGGGDRGDPITDYDGSGYCYVTDNADGNSDVDGGPTRLVSPVFSLAGSDGYVQYARWFTNDDNDSDRLTVEVSNDGGNNWTLVRSVGNQSGWILDSFNVADFIVPTSNMVLRFAATDNPNDSVTEAGIDAVRIVKVNCGAPGGMYLEVDPLVSGQSARFTAGNATTGQRVYFTYSTKGLGETFVPQLNVTLGISNPKLLGSDKANVAGYAALIRKVPGNASGVEVWVQAAEVERISNIVNQVVQ